MRSIAFVAVLFVARMRRVAAAPAPRALDAMRGPMPLATKPAARRSATPRTRT